MNKIRWGILGAAQIARKNWKAIRHTGNGIIAAVASRDRARSEQFISECQANTPFPERPLALGSYEELLALRELDAVYIPLPTGLRKEWVIRAAEAGKHVVCEKPCAANVADLRDMIEACRRNHVQFMDGVMFAHSRRLDRLREVLDDGVSVGAIRHIGSAFSFCAPEAFLNGNIRMHSELEPLGCLGDLGWYCIRFALWVAHWKLPRQVTGRILTQQGATGSPASVPTEFSGELLFEGGLSSQFYCSFLTELQQWANVSGTRGYLRVPDFVVPFFGSEVSFDLYNSVFRIEGCDFNMERRQRCLTVQEYSNGQPTAQETNLFRHFAEQIQQGDWNALWPEMALKTQQVLNACLDSALAGGAPVKL